ncbi:uncharacterized protein PHA67_016260 [Liasis olivaceus]
MAAKRHARCLFALHLIFASHTRWLDRGWAPLNPHINPLSGALRAGFSLPHGILWGGERGKQVRRAGWVSHPGPPPPPPRPSGRGLFSERASWAVLNWPGPNRRSSALPSQPPEWEPATGGRARGLRRPPCRRLPPTARRGRTRAVVSAGGPCSWRSPRTVRPGNHRCTGVYGLSRPGSCNCPPPFLGCVRETGAPQLRLGSSGLRRGRGRLGGQHASLRDQCLKGAAEEDFAGPRAALRLLLPKPLPPGPAPARPCGPHVLWSCRRRTGWEETRSGLLPAWRREERGRAPPSLCLAAVGPAGCSYSRGGGGGGWAFPSSFGNRGASQGKSSLRNFTAGARRSAKRRLEVGPESQLAAVPRGEPTFAGGSAFRGHVPRSIDAFGFQRLPSEGDLEDGAGRAEKGAPPAGKAAGEVCGASGWAAASKEGKPRRGRSSTEDEAQLVER